MEEADFYQLSERPFISLLSGEKIKAITKKKPFFMKLFSSSLKKKKESKEDVLKDYFSRIKIERSNSKRN